MAQPSQIDIDDMCEDYISHSLFRPGANIPPDVLEFVRYIHAHLLDENLTVDGALNACRLRSSSFAGRFRRYVGLGKKEYILHHRIELAKRLLATGRWTVGEISCRVGFASISAFSKQFRLVCGRSPSTWYLGVKSKSLDKD